MISNLKKWTWREARRQVMFSFWVEVTTIRRVNKYPLWGSDALLEINVFWEVKKLQKKLYSEIVSAILEDFKFYPVNYTSRIFKCQNK